MNDPLNEKAASFGPNSLIKGEITLQQDAVIEGAIEGVLKVNGKLTITDTARIVGIIIADEIQLTGHAEGNIIARELIELHTGASISGRLYTARLVMGEGVILQAETNVGPAALAAANAVIEAFDSQQVVFKAEQEKQNTGPSVKAPQLPEIKESAPATGQGEAGDPPMVVTNPATVSNILKNMQPLAVETQQ